MLGRAQRQRQLGGVCSKQQNGMREGRRLVGWEGDRVGGEVVGTEEGTRSGRRRWQGRLSSSVGAGWVRRRLGQWWGTSGGAGMDGGVCTYPGWHLPSIDLAVLSGWAERSAAIRVKRKAESGKRTNRQQGLGGWSGRVAAGSGATVSAANARRRLGPTTSPAKLAAAQLINEIFSNWARRTHEPHSRAGSTRRRDTGQCWVFTVKTLSSTTLPAWNHPPAPTPCTTTRPAAYSPAPPPANRPWHPGPRPALDVDAPRLLLLLSPCIGRHQAYSGLYLLPYS
ncbi:hypothetical protein GGTG_05230 [Gaeumannomyces tritici R3-111a-1]|uniref:Uncharacterized protein n=1 Tax=Gaeumannomyces tritici (strain R3-111a-1) TaxID=644352 RepID=J3NVB7_GAET3|nr:hypothetical protein GGTG_05230 [Gaeumannomyces tritici R3-111a-1]EJT75293.1 hypothetical protein GGTG_05230 [Gaeumannomyces tritici R3-111a-1]